MFTNPEESVIVPPTAAVHGATCLMTIVNASFTGVGQFGLA
ncbi:MAG TPA: hypothetical protein VMZ49_03645 [Patescibacteria group bacterium]|nr:hypothetical protein [Patescibacteria group bacterium]